MNNLPEPDLQPPNLVKLPSPLERVALRASRLPWWAIILGVGLILALYGIVTTPLYHDALAWVTNDPQLTTTDYQSVTYLATVGGQSQKVSGILVAQDARIIKIRTVDPEAVTVPRVGIANVQRTGDNIVVSIGARPVEGIFYTEKAASYSIQLPSGEIVSVPKADVRSTEKRTPSGCQPDTQGSCRISVVVPSSEVSGTLLAENADNFTIQTVAPAYVTVNRADIQEVIGEGPGSCALNNLGSCQKGIFLTGYLTLTAYALALVIGLLIALMRISSQPVFTNFATLYVEVVRGIPILVILLIFYFVVGPWVRDNLHIPMPEVVRAILGLAFAYGAFLAEIFRAGIQSIGRGQMEAARSLGMTYPQAMRYIVLPQAIRVVLPPLGNDFIAMLKDTSLVALISLSEMTQRATLFQSRRLLTFEPYLTIAALYLVMTLVLSMIVRIIENRMRIA